MDLSTERKVHMMDLQEDLVYQKSVTPAPRRICPVIHTTLHVVVDAAEEENKADDKV